MIRSGNTQAVRVISYNVLSSHLGGTDYFTSCSPENLNPHARLHSLKSKLSSEISSGRPIICLQEISTTWSGKLYPFFNNEGYCFIMAHYGKRFNGYMGVGIAFPLDTYELLDADITTISDTKRKPPREKVDDRMIKKVVTWFTAALAFMIPTWLKSLVVKPVEDPWSAALWRNNQLVALKLQQIKSPKRAFTVGTYHMPCMFDKPPVMAIHTSLSVQHLQQYAGDDPLIYCGDFNFKPNSFTYRIITEATADPSSPEFPPAHFPADTWSLAKHVKPMRSAYREKLGKEPEFTNYAKIKDDPIFIDTLDYIFLSEHWNVLSVNETPSKEQALTHGPMPTADEPSDHLLVSAALTLTK